ncbi:hypothetical protein ACQY0O_000201 [Thecaphora frezii]
MRFLHLIALLASLVLVQAELVPRVRHIDYSRLKAHLPKPKTSTCIVNFPDVNSHAMFGSRDFGETWREHGSSYWTYARNKGNARIFTFTSKGGLMNADERFGNSLAQAMHVFFSYPGINAVWSSPNPGRIGNYDISCSVS